ncbi:hypothetical protein ACFL4F_00395 [Candidatus Margulisiibacteriota bacterium]
MRSKGNVLLVFMMLIGLSFIVFTVASVVTTRVKEAGGKVARSKSFYIAEAGLQKAAWYLATDPGSGGFGSDWRGTTTEAFGAGTFSITVQDTAVAGRVKIIATGEAGGVSRTITQLAAIESYPDAFSYSVFCGTGNFRATGNAMISGDMYVNGNSDFVGDASLGDGVVYHAEGYSVSGDAPDGGTPSPEPTMPSFDTSYYDGEITVAEAAAAGDQTYSSGLDLSGGTIYVNGNLTITGGSITGPGTIVATGTINISGTPVGDGNDVEFISKGTTSITGSPDIPASTFYSRDDLAIAGNTEIELGALLTSGDFDATGNMSFSGAIFSEGEAKITGDVVIDGSLVSNTFKHISGNPVITFDATQLSETIPPGFTGGSPSLMKGTWEEL